MKQRVPLLQGTSVQQYVIERVIGMGAGSIVYEAYFFDSKQNRKEIVLKECYPCSAEATRKGNELVWDSSEQKQKAFARFNKTYEIASKIQNTEGVRSVSVYSLDIFEDNETQYIAMIPSGNFSYDNDISEDIFDIIRAVLALTNALKAYHKAGYLHLDVKPSNFIALEDQTGRGKNIVLFDVDTVVSEDEIKSGNIRSVSYSNEWAAPKQRLQQINKLSPATDLFSIGAVLF